MTTTNRRNITDVYRSKRIKPAKTPYAGQTHNAQRTNGQKIASGNRADAITNTYQIHSGKNPETNLPPLTKIMNDALGSRFFGRRTKEKIFTQWDS